MTRALALGPKVIILDEPVSGLDVSIRAQIMNLLKDLQQEHGLSYLLIAHDLATVRYMCDKIGGMYLGRMVEEAETEELFENPLHPYTRALMSAATVTDNLLKRVVQTFISVTDIDRAVSFYRDTLGMELLFQIKRPPFRPLKWDSETGDSPYAFWIRTATTWVFLKSEGKVSAPFRPTACNLVRNAGRRTIPGLRVTQGSSGPVTANPFSRRPPRRWSRCGIRG